MFAIWGLSLRIKSVLVRLIFKLSLLLGFKFQYFFKEIKNELTHIRNENPFYVKKKLDLTKIKKLVHHNKKLECKDSSKNVLHLCKFKNNCDPNADCIYNTFDFKYFCKCFIGYIGNGYKCYGKFYFLNKKNFNTKHYK